MTTTMTISPRSHSAVGVSRRAVSMNDTPLEPPRFVDNAFEQSCDGIRAEGAFPRYLAHVFQHILLAIRLIDLDPLCLLQFAHRAYAPGPFVEQADQDFVHPVDI